MFVDFSGLTQPIVASMVRIAVHSIMRLLHSDVLLVAKPSKSSILTRLVLKR